MGAVDAMRDVYPDGGVSDDFLLILGFLVIAVAAFTFVFRVLPEVCHEPHMWPVVVGSVAFWPLAFTGHLKTAMAVCLGSLAITMLLTNRNEEGPPTEGPKDPGP